MKDDKRLKRKVRNSYIVSNISIALVLFLLGSVGYLMTAAMQVARTLQESVTVTVELRNGADEKQKESLRKRFEANELVSHVEYSSKDDKLNDTDFRHRPSSGCMPRSRRSGWCCYSSAEPCSSSRSSC